MHLQRLLMILPFLGVGLIGAFQSSFPVSKDPSIAPWIEKARLADKQEQYDSLRVYAETIIAMYQQKGEMQAARAWYHHLFQGYIYDATLSYEEQYAAIEAKKKDILDSQDPVFIADYYSARMELHTNYGEVDSAMFFYNQVESLAKTHYAPSRLVNLYLLASVNFLDVPADAQNYLEQARPLLSKINPEESFGAIRAFYQINSVVYNELNDYIRSIDGNLELIRKYGNYLKPLEFLSAYSDIAVAYHNLEDSQSALAYYEKAIQYNESDDIPWIEKAISCSNLAVSYNDHQQPEKGLYHARKALHYLQQEQNEDIQKDLYYIYSTMAYSFGRLNQLDSLLYYAQKAEKMNPEGIQHYDAYIIYYKSKDINKVLAYQEKMLAVTVEKNGKKNSQVATQYLKLSTIYQQKQDLHNAWLCAKQAWSSIVIDSTTDLERLDFKKVLHIKRLAFVVDHHIDLLESSLKMPENPLGADLGMLYRYAKLSTRILEFQSSSFKSEGSKMEKLQKEAQRVYEKAIKIALRLYQKDKEDRYLNEAFLLAEQSKSMLLLDALQESKAAQFAGIPDSLVQKETQLQRQLTQVEKRRLDALLRQDTFALTQQEQAIFAIQHEVKALEHLFEQNYPTYYQLKYQPISADIQQVQAALDEKTTLLEFVEGQEETYLFQISKQGVDVQVYSHEPNYEVNLDSFLHLLMDAKTAVERPLEQYNRFVQEAHRYYQRYIPQTLPAQTERLIIIPDGKLSYVPFEVLLMQPVAVASEEQAIRYGQLDYLLKHYTVNYNYSMSLWLSQRNTEEKVINHRILAMAATYETDSSAYSYRNPRERKARRLLQPLSGAVEEVDHLQSTLSGEFAIGTAANEADFKQKAPQYGILHLAMHGLVNGNEPEYSGLAFTENGDTTQDNFLYAYEIKQLPLQAGLVVLSACETGVGKYQRGEGVISIGRGFMYAGAPSLLMTLWSLNDRSGAALIQFFYENLRKGMHKDQAIQQAKLEYLEQARGIAAHPSMWACFVQMGDYAPLLVAEKKSSVWYWLAGGGALFLLALAVQKKIKS